MLNNTLINRSVFAKDALATKLTVTAMSITRLVVDTQNAERKAFLDHLRKQQSECVANAQKWQKLVEQLAHEQGLWFISESYPRSWEIDPTEGPARMRVRLRRCHHNIPEKFVQEGFRDKLRKFLYYHVDLHVSQE